MLRRKCAACGEEIIVSLPYSRDYVYYGAKKKWYHARCFLESIVRPRIDVDAWYDKTSAFVTSEVSKDNVCQLFLKQYGVSCISARQFKKLNEIYNGTYKGLAQPISPYELYDILSRKHNYLMDTFSKRNISGNNRIDYALAVAMGSYNDYKAWRANVEEEQRARDERQKHGELGAQNYLFYNAVAEEPEEMQDTCIDYEAALNS